MKQQLERYNVVWDSPSKDASGSMPIGNGDFGANVWVEEGGDLILLLGKTDAWDENSINMKLGRVRVSLTPNPFSGGAPFRQVLELPTGDIAITGGPPESSVTIRIWADANRPVIHVDADGAAPFDVRATVEVWRKQEYAIKTQTGDLFQNLTGPNPSPTVVTPDHVFPAAGNRIAWCHHNGPRENDGYEINMKLQGLGGFLDRMPHPLRGRTFGGAVDGDGFIAESDAILRSRGAVKSHRLSVYAITLHPSTPEQWRGRMDEVIASVRAVDASVARKEHERWWEEFWGRSWIYATSDDPKYTTSAFNVTRGYVLQRFMNAAAGRGAHPVKFNGSIFTVGKPEDPDFRRWGGPGFWFQNMRLIYWPMLAAGDWDLLAPFFRMYREMLPLQRHRTQTYYRHGGAHYPETITFWGTEVSAHYGWTPFEQRKAPEAECSYVTYYWTCGIELTLMAWSYFAHTGDDAFARDTLVPIADAVTEFFDVHYPRDERGEIRFAPSQALETWHEATNPLPDVAGLRYTLPKLLELPHHLTTDSMRARWERMLSELPPVPRGEKDGRAVLLPAERFDKKKNTENPELYAVFPFRLFGVGKPDLEVARDTFAARLHAADNCWSQDDIQMAFLGLADAARDHLSNRAADASHSQSRFPAFWDAFHDWIPDMDHGGVLQMALQSMLLQHEGRGIQLLPAWPTGWDAEFKLHAPGRTVIEGRVVGGRVKDLQVTPPGRTEDVRGTGG